MERSSQKRTPPGWTGRGHESGFDHALQRVAEASRDWLATAAKARRMPAAVILAVVWAG